MGKGAIMKQFLGGLKTLALVATFALVATGCGNESNPVGNNEESSAPVVVYSGRSEKLVSELFVAFTAETGIEVDVRYGDSGEMAALILTEGSSSPASMFFSQDAGALGAVEDADLFATLPSEILSLVEPKYSSLSGSWVGTSGRARVVVYNPTLVNAPPATIDDLLDPKWFGAIGYAPTNASWQSFVTALRLTRGEDAARLWLQGFAANNPVAYEKNGAVRDAVNSGEVALGLVNHYYLYEKIAAEGDTAVIAKNHYFTNGDIGGLVNVAGVGMLKSSKNQKSTLALINYLLSVVGQEYFAQKSFEYPLVSGIPQYGDLPTLAELNSPNIDLSDLRSIAETQELLAEVGLLTK
jgi:iron(III) transport system substrate-binding protein